MKSVPGSKIRNLKQSRRFRGEQVSTTIRVPEDLCLDTPLWQFAGQFWSRDRAQTAALTLQDRDWKVTEILCALWLALEGRRYNGTIAAPVLIWRSQVTEALRRARRVINKDNPVTDTARAQIARGELEAEKVELALAHRALAENEVMVDMPQGSSLQTLALENLQAAAPEYDMDNEIGKLLETLTSELAIFARGVRTP